VNVADRNSSVEIGRINITQLQTFFEVPREAAQGVIESFAKSFVDFEGRKVAVTPAGEGNPVKRDEKRAAHPYSKPKKPHGHWKKK